MLETNVALPSKPRIVSEEEFRGIYEVDSTQGTAIRSAIRFAASFFLRSPVQLSHR
jgi:hypothetical protein